VDGELAVSDFLTLSTYEVLSIYYVLWYCIVLTIPLQLTVAATFVLSRHRVFDWVQANHLSHTWKWRSLTTVRFRLIDWTCSQKA